MWTYHSAEEEIALVKERIVFVDSFVHLCIYIVYVCTGWVQHCGCGIIYDEAASQASFFLSVEVSTVRALHASSDRCVI